MTGLKYGLPILSPVNDDGKFTEEAGQFYGLNVLADGNVAVVKYLDEHLSLIMEESYGKSSFILLEPKMNSIYFQFLKVTITCGGCELFHLLL